MKIKIMESIDYKVVRGRRRTIVLNVDRNGEVIVRVPISLSGEEIARFVIKHRRWIERRKALRLEHARLSFADGQQLSLFGKSYPIITGDAEITDCAVCLPAEHRESALERLLKVFCLEPMVRLTEQIALRNGLSFSRVRISSAKSRWGSCNRNGVIAYSYRLSFLSPDLIEYIVVHELCHTLYFNHGAAFWREVFRILPDAKLRRNRLKSYSYLMDTTEN